MNAKRTPELSTPELFLQANPKYVYYSHKGMASVQWKQAALDMCAERDRLRGALSQLLRRLDLCAEEGTAVSHASAEIEYARAVLERTKG